MAATVQIVTAVGSGGQVLMDLNAAPSGVGARLGPRGDVKLADVQMASAGDQPFIWSGTANAGAPGALASRQITVPVVLTANSADGLAVQVALLQSLTRTRFLLKIQRHGSTAPAWLRCAPCAPRLDTQVSAAGQPTTMATGTIVAQTEPYAIGARVDVGPQTITQDPASGTPWIWDIDNVPGDALTPLVLRWQDDAISNAEDRLFVSTRRRGTPTALAGLVVQAEDATITAAGPGAAVFTGDSTFSGSSGVGVTYSSGGDWTLSAPFGGLAGFEAPGVYRLLVRCRRGSTAAGKLFSLVAQVGPQRMVGTFTVSGNDTRVIDLGLVQVPIGTPPFLAAPETPAQAAAPTVALTVVYPQAAGGTFQVDWLALVPADQDAGVLDVGGPVPGAGMCVVLDGWDQQPRVYDDDPYTALSPVAQGATALGWIGGAPRLRPGSNRLYMITGLGASTASARTPATSFAVSGSYWPRYGWLT
jgi:hypothetical protein